MKHSHLIPPLFLLLLTGLVLAAPPETPKRPVTDTYHGVAITDDYRWLEDGKSKDVQAWIDAQNTLARAYLDKLPGVEALRKRLTTIMTAKRTGHSALTFRGGQLFGMRSQPPKQQPFLVVMPAPDQPDKARVLVDPNDLDKKGTTAIDWFVPSPDGKLVAVSLSQGGSESGDVHVYDTATAKPVYEVVPHAHGGTAGGDLAWAPDGKGFFYTRYPRGQERPPEDMDFYQQVYYHALGTPTEKDRYELGKDLPRIAEIKLEMHDASGRLLATVQNGDSGQFAHYLRTPDGRWKQFANFPDEIVQAAFGPKDDIYLVSRRGAPRGKILRASVPDPDVSKAAVIVPEGQDTIVTDFYGMSSRQTVLPTASRLYVTFQLGGPSAIRAFDLNGRPAAAPKQLPVSTVGGLTQLTGDDILFANGSFVEPRNHYLYRAEKDETVKLPLESPPPVELSDVSVVREMATSKDGTKVPVNILVPKGVKLDGTNPCLVTGYGGFGISQAPSFHAEWRVLFDHGFVVAVANLRGGGEFGEAWHRAGSLTSKQNVFDDFAAVLKHMIDQRYTSPQRLAVLGGSNGGLLMGATLTQHPDLVKAVVSFVGIYDMLRVELSSNGAFNIPEYGTVKDEKQFKALYAYSPYHQIKDGVKYPATLFLTGANDPRVDPMQSRKMTARLQAATASQAPILLRTSASSGHGLDSSLSERIEETVDVYAFLFAQLGVKVREVEEAIFEPGAKLKVEAGGGVGGEGPAWHPKLGVLTSGNGHVNQLDREGKSQVYRKGAGTNGLLFDTKGRLLACESDARRMTRTELDGTITVLTDRYQGKRYNTPNDLTLDSQGRLYFSDPRYGDRKSMEMLDEKDQTVEGVYRIDPDGKVTRVIGRELERPNGVLVSADDRYLYVADNNNNNLGGARKLYRFDLKKDGAVDLANRKLIYDWGKGRGPDGLKQDQQGRLYVAAGLNKPNPPFEPAEDVKGGIYVLSPEGKLLAFLPVPTDEVTNCAFGDDDLKTLYITGGGTLYSIRTMTPGRVVWPAGK
jgi:prolyl oligopeptidase